MSSRSGTPFALLPDPWTDRLAGLAAIRGFIGESTIKESSEITIHTRVLMPFLQSLSITVAFVLMCVGGWVLIDGIVVAFDIGINRGMYLLVSVMLAGGIAAVIYGSRHLFDTALGATAIGFGSAVLLLLIVAVFSAATELKDDFSLLRSFEIVLGAGILLGSVLLIHHQILNMTDPYWRTSPAEREMLAMWRQGPQPTKRHATRIPYRHGSQSSRILAEEDTEDIYPADIEFEVLDFLEQAITIGIGRNPWVADAVRRLPSTGAVVGRDKYDDILDRLEADGYVIRGGRGKAARWAKDWTAKTVYEKECTDFEKEWADVLEFPAEMLKSSDNT